MNEKNKVLIGLLSTLMVLSSCHSSDNETLFPSALHNEIIVKYLQFDTNKMSVSAEVFNCSSYNLSRLVFRLELYEYNPFSSLGLLFSESQKLGYTDNFSAFVTQLSDSISRKELHERILKKIRLGNYNGEYSRIDQLVYDFHKRWKKLILRRKVEITDPLDAGFSKNINIKIETGVPISTTLNYVELKLHEAYTK